MNIIEITGFVICFSFNPNESSVSCLSQKINYGNGSIYQKFKKSTPSTMHENLKSIKEVNFFMADTFSQSFKFTVVEKDFETARHFAKVMVNLLKEIHHFKEEVVVEIEQVMIVSEMALKFKI
jgi:hypothetical protein